MIRDLGTIAEVTGGTLRGPAALVPSGWSIDTRTLKPGDLFFAIIGPNHDGHRFVAAALEKGACGVVVSEPDAAGTGHPVLVVADTLRALQDLAAAWRRS